MVLFRYISREFIPPFVFSLSLIIFLFVLNLLFQMLGRIAGKGLPWNTVAEFFVLNLAWMVALAVPMAVLVATLTTYGRLGADGEITALKASGVGPVRLLLPALVMGLTVAAVLVIFNDRFLPDMNRRSRQLQADIKRKKPTMVLEPGVFLSDIPGHVLIAREVNQDSSELGDLVVYQENDPDYATTITAKQGRLRYSEAAEGFEFALTDGQIERQSKKKPAEYQQTDFERAIFRISAPEMSLKRTESNWRGDREMNVGQLRGRIVEYELRDPVNLHRDIDKLKVELHKKFSIPAACIVFAFLGMIIGQWVRKSGLGVSAGYSIFFFLIYWVFLIGGEDLADRDRLDPWLAMWAPNILFFGLALVLFWQERRGRPLISFAWLPRWFGR
ncbi:LptF/LptG family permease [candidate division KSB1 bacterium]|nr:LptF/LptG family permease [candidate division KSB1 bacterium]